ILFQIPVISYYLSKIGLLTPQFMVTYRRHAIITALILASILTPPDPISQIMIALPLVILYQFSIFLSKIAVRRRKEEFEEAMSDAES
ncbi:MAG TPA: twin-arginine translocase subunit TatC, partial [Balneolaceae bacterium]|nr:twin-arginine translocase subunit TatC [Balneolaceae bacterium]